MVTAVLAYAQNTLIKKEKRFDYDIRMCVGKGEGLEDESCIALEMVKPDSSPENVQRGLSQTNVLRVHRVKQELENFWPLVAPVIILKKHET